MNMRRARIQVRPNVGPRGRASATPTEENVSQSKADVTQHVKTEDVKLEKSPENKIKEEDSKNKSNEENKSFTVTLPPAHTPVPAETNVETVEGKKTSSSIDITKAPAANVMRRSRFKPQVKVTAKPRVAVTSRESSTTALETKPSGAVTPRESSTTALETKPTPCDIGAMAIETKVKGEKEQEARCDSSGQQSSKTVTEPGADSDCQKEKRPADSAQEQNKLAEKKRQITPMRGRFLKPRPNLVETGRKRFRQTSLSGASDTDDDGHTAAVKRAPPPIQRTALLTSKNPEKIKENIPDYSSEPDSKQQGQLVVSTGVSVESNVDCDESPASSTYTNIRPDRGDKPIRPRVEFRKKLTEPVPRNIRKTVLLDRPVDRSKMKISELIYTNPVANRMKSSIEEEIRKHGHVITRRILEEGELIMPPSRRKKKITSPDRQSEGSQRRPSLGSPDRQSVASERRPSIDSPDRKTAVSERRPSMGSPDRQSEASVNRSRVSIGSPDRESERNEDDWNEEDETDELAPQVSIGPDGEIILNQKSLFVANPDPDRTIEESEVVEEFGNAPYKPSLYYGRGSKTKSWGWRETKKFYLALSVIGSDFSMISTLFPGRSRVDIKKKFKREEKANRFLVEKALKEPKTFDTTIFDNLSSSEDEDVRKQRIKDERVRKKKEASEIKEQIRVLEKLEKDRKRAEDKALRMINGKKKKKKKEVKSRKILYDTSSSESDGEELIENVPPYSPQPGLTGMHNDSDDDREMMLTHDPSAAIDVPESSLILNMTSSRRILYDDSISSATYRSDILDAGTPVGASLEQPCGQSTPTFVEILQNSNTNLTPTAVDIKTPEYSQSARNPLSVENTHSRIRTASGSYITPGSSSRTVKSSDGSQLVFVSKYKPSEKEGEPGTKVVHMYMVSPPPTMPANNLTSAGVPKLTVDVGNTGTSNQEAMILSPRDLQVLSETNPPNLSQTISLQPMSDNISNITSRHASNDDYSAVHNVQQQVETQQPYHQGDLSAVPHNQLDPGNVLIVLEDDGNTKVVSQQHGSASFMTDNLQSPPPRVISITPLIKDVHPSPQQQQQQLQPVDIDKLEEDLINTQQSGLIMKSSHPQEITASNQTQTTVLNTQLPGTMQVNMASDVPTTSHSIPISQANESVVYDSELGEFGIVNEMQSAVSTVQQTGVVQSQAPQVAFTYSTQEPASYISSQQTNVLSNTLRQEESLVNTLQQNVLTSIGSSQVQRSDSYQRTTHSPCSPGQAFRSRGASNQKSVISVQPQYPSPSPIFTIPKLSLTSTAVPLRRNRACSNEVSSDNNLSSENVIEIDDQKDTDHDEVIVDTSTNRKESEIINITETESVKIGSSKPSTTGSSFEQLSNENEIQEVTSKTNISDKKVEGETKSIDSKGEECDEVKTINIRIISNSSDVETEEGDTRLPNIGGATISADSGEIKFYLN